MVARCHISVSAGRLACASPPLSVGYHRLRVSTNGQNYFDDGIAFEVVGGATVVALEPRKGPVDGGSLVRVLGSGFDERASVLGYMHCRFNVSKVQAQWIDEGEVECRAPRNPAGPVRVELTLNDQQYTTDMVAFEYQDVVAHSIEPRNGPVLGGTLVVVRGANFHAPGSRGLFCKFVGADVVAASWEGEEAVRCATPSVAAAGFVAVHLISNDAVYVTSVAFQYQEAVSVLSVEPRTGLLTGGTLLRVLGSGFVPSMTALVRVGSQPVVVARVLSSVLLECTTPVHSLGAKPLLLSMNAQQYSGGSVLYTYQPAAVVSSVSPFSVPTEGGTPVTVHGAHFSAASEAAGLLLCRIGSTVRKARWASTSALVCNTTRSAAGAVRIEVSNNGREYTSDGVRLELVSVRVLDVQPWSGPVTGATVVSVRGRGSLPGGDVRCGFGEATASSGWSSGVSRLRCASAASAVTGWVSVQLSSGSIALSSGGSFYYHAALRTEWRRHACDTAGRRLQGRVHAALPL